MVKDSKGNELKVGDIVLFTKYDTDTQGYKVNTRYRVIECNIIKGYERISTECIKTGRQNGWAANYFTKVTDIKNHLPKWF